VKFKLHTQKSGFYAGKFTHHHDEWRVENIEYYIAYITAGERP